ANGGGASGRDMAQRTDVGNVVARSIAVSLLVLPRNYHRLRQHDRPVDETSHDVSMARDRSCDLVYPEWSLVRKRPDADAFGHMPRQTIEPGGRRKCHDDKASWRRM